MTRYIPVTDVAKMIRKALAKEFPGQKFSVKSDKYAGGASIDIRWTDGPTQKEVDAVTNPYRGAGFDGMIDLKYHVDSWLMPDGFTMLYGRSMGTGVSMGCDPAYNHPQPHPDAELVSSMADHVSTSRKHSLAYIQDCVAKFEAQYNRTAPIINLCEKESWNGGLYADYQWDYDYPDFHSWEHHFQTILRETSCFAKPKPKPEATPTTSADNAEVQITTERNWTWVKFGTKPASTVLEAMKAQGARFSGKRVAWYFTQPVPESTIRALVCA